MRTTIDRAGRVVIPRRLREQVGLRAGDVEITADGAGVKIEPVAGEGFIEKNGRLVIPGAGTLIDDEVVRELRDADQR